MIVSSHPVQGSRCGGRGCGQGGFAWLEFMGFESSEWTRQVSFVLWALQTQMFIYLSFVTEFGLNPTSPSPWSQYGWNNKNSQDKRGLYEENTRGSEIFTERVLWSIWVLDGDCNKTKSTAINCRNYMEWGGGGVSGAKFPGAHRFYEVVMTNIRKIKVLAW